MIEIDRRLLPNIHKYTQNRVIMNRMLISATQADEVRVALVKEQILYDLDIEYPGFEQKKANIYKGKVSRIEPSLEAAFIEYGAERHGFLPFKEVARSYFKPEVINEPFSRLGIKDALYEGQEIMVQIDKEERGNKGAALSTFISLAGSYLVLMPNNPRVGGVSRRIEGKERDDLRDLMHNLNLPEGMGVIIRTAGTGKSHGELRWDLDSLLRCWSTIETSYPEHPAPFLVHQEGDAVMRAIRDYLRQDIEEILVDTKELFEKTKKYIEQVKPDFIDKIKWYQSHTPLFTFYQIEQQIETAYQRVVRLPSGGSISIDHTEALISIDVNSARATGGSDIEETAFNTNLEAAEEIARQLRLRDIGGLIVIDFIDMSQVKHQREVSHKLRDALEHDRARVQVGHITRFGLLEMSRQRLRSHLGSAMQITCPRCEGKGTIRSVESLASSLIRVIEEESIKENTAEIQAQLPVELATFMLNEKRSVIVDIATKQKVNIKILPNKYLETPLYQIKRIRTNELFKSQEASYKLAALFNNPKPSDKKEFSISTPEKSLATTANSPEKPKNSEAKPSIFGQIKTIFSSLLKSDNQKVSTSSSVASSTLERPAIATNSSLSTAAPRSRSPLAARNQRKVRRTGSTENKNRRSGGSHDRDPRNTKTQRDAKRQSLPPPPPPPSDDYHEITAKKVEIESMTHNSVQKKPEYLPKTADNFTQINPTASNEAPRTPEISITNSPILPNEGSNSES